MSDKPRKRELAEKRIKEKKDATPRRKKEALNNLRNYKPRKGWL